MKSRTHNQLMLSRSTGESGVFLIQIEETFLRQSENELHQETSLRVTGSDCLSKH